MQITDIQTHSITTVTPCSEITDEQANYYYQLCDVIKKHQEGFLEVAGALFEVKKLNLWRVEHKSWRDFVTAKLGFSGAHADRMISLADFMREAKIAKLAGPSPNMNQAQELKRIGNPLKAARLWKIALTKAQARGKPKPSLEDVADLVELEIKAKDKSLVTTQDWVGNEVEGEMAKTFTTSRQLIDAKNEIKAIRKRLLAMAGAPGTELMSPGAITQALGGAESLLVSMIPHSICLNPACEGGCAACHGHGWVNERDWREQKRVLARGNF